jgi:hypothetical protein
VVFWSDEVDLKTTGTQMVTLADDMFFDPVEVGLVITAASGVSTQPYISFGWYGDNDGLISSIQTTGLTNQWDRKPFTSLSAYGGKESITAEVVTAGSASGDMKCRFYWVGYILPRD